MSIKTYPLHPACSVWPQMPADELSQLAASMKSNGQREPATITPDGQLIDGRNRQDACIANDIELQVITYDGDPILYSLDKNKHRRHMSKTDLAFVCAKMDTLAHGGDRSKMANAILTDTQKAQAAGIDPGDIRRARAIEAQGTAEIIDLTKTKKVGLRSAYDYVTSTPKDQQVADPEVIRAKRVSKQEAFDAAVLKEVQKLMEAYDEVRIREEAQKFLHETLLPNFMAQHEEYKAMAQRNAGVFSKEDYNKILFCLHPDRVHGTELFDRYNEAFRLFNKYKDVLIIKPPPAPPAWGVPRTVEGLRAAKERYEQEQRAKASKTA